MKLKNRSHFLAALKLTLLVTWIFTSPTNLFWKILPNFGFVGGLQIDYLIPKLYLSDIFGILMIGVFFIEGIFFNFKKIEFKNNYVRQLFALFSLLLFARQFFTPSPIAAVWFFISLSIHIITVLIAFQWVKNRSDLWKRILIGAVAVTIFFQSILGIYQFVYQKQLAGFLFFGETQLTRDIGLSKASFANVDSLVGTRLGLRILPYGTTPHPNVLAGFLVLGMLVIVLHGFPKSITSAERVLLISSIAIGTVTLLLTTSISAGLTLFIGASLFTFENFFKKFTQSLSFPRIYVLDFFIFICILIPVAVHVMNTSTQSPSTSLSRRDFLNQTAVDSISKNFIIGSGLNQFTIEVSESSQNQKEAVPFIQPAHHTPLLFLAENGLLGVLVLILFGLMINQTHSMKSLKYFVVLLPILSLDHYFYTLTPGQYILETSWLLWLL